jgi:chromosomal replication initiation ATPase DnaA
MDRIASEYDVMVEAELTRLDMDSEADRARQIVEKWADSVGLSVEAFRQRGRPQRLTRARCGAMRELRAMGLPLKAVGGYVNRDHSSIIHHLRMRCACDKIKSSAHTDAKLTIS